jgi:hyperosmotically inducible periplasmic protein
MMNGPNDLVTVVTAALLAAETLGRAVIEVKELDGIVTLKGIVSSLEAKVIAESITLKQEGVVQVINQLTVSYHEDDERFFGF